MGPARHRKPIPCPDVTDIDQIAPHADEYEPQFIPGVFSAHSVLRDRQFGYNVEETAEFLQGTDVMCRQQYWASVAQLKGADEGKADPAAKKEVEAAPNESKQDKAAGLKEEPRKVMTPAQGLGEAKKISAASTSAKESAPVTSQGPGASKKK